MCYVALPVCVEALGDATSRYVEPLLRVADAREGTHLLHLLPLQLFQPLAHLWLQCWTQQIPQRGAAGARPDSQHENHHNINTLILRPYISQSSGLPCSTGCTSSR